MKLAEALLQRKACQSRIEVLRTNLLRYAKVQEGEITPENPKDIAKDIDITLEELYGYISRINRTNSETAFDEKLSISDALAYRDVLEKKYKIIRHLIETATELTNRYSKQEIKILSNIDVPAFEKRANEIAKEFRELDIKIQEKNWLVDLI